MADYAIPTPLSTTVPTLAHAWAAAARAKVRNPATARRVREAAVSAAQDMAAECDCPEDRPCAVCQHVARDRHHAGGTP